MSCSCRLPGCDELAHKLQAMPDGPVKQELLGYIETREIKGNTLLNIACFRVVNLLEGAPRKIRLRLWHFPQSCLDTSSPPSILLRQTCKANPDESNNDKFTIANVTSSNPVSFKRSNADDRYVTAPTMSIAQFEAFIVHVDRRHGNARLGADARLANLNQALANLDPLVKEHHAAQIAELRRKHDIEVKNLEQQLESVKRQRAENDRVSEYALGAFHIANLGKKDYWEHVFQKDTSLFRSFFPFLDPSRLFGYLKAVRVIFNVRDDDDVEFFPDITTELISIAHNLADSLTTTSVNKFYKSQGLRHVEAQILCMINRRQRLSIRAMSVTIGGVPGGVSRQVLAQTLQVWIPRFAAINHVLCTLNIIEPMARQMMPGRMTEIDSFKNVYGIIDGRDIMIDRVRVNSGIGRASYSSKINAAAARGIVIVHPSGLPVFVSELVFARCDEMTLTEALAKQGLLPDIPEHMSIMGDRAYTSLRLWLPNKNQVLTTANKTKGLSQFAEKDLKFDRLNSSFRYRVEVANGRQAEWQTADDVVPREDLHNLTNTWYIAWGCQLFMEPLEQPRLQKLDGTIMRFEALVDLLVHVAWSHGGQW